MTYPILPGYIDLSEAIRRAGSQSRLLGQIIAGDISFTLVERDGTSRPIEKQFWVDADLRLILERGYVSDGLSKGLPQIKLTDFQKVGADIWSQTIPAKRADRSSGARPKQEEVVTRSRGGRPPKYEQSLFLIEAFRILYEGKHLSSEAEYRDLALRAFAARGGGDASEDWARPLISLVVKELELSFSEKPR